MIDLEQERIQMERLQGQISHLEQTVQDEKSNSEEAEKHLHRTQAAQEILQRVAQAVQQKAHERIGSVVTSCLSSVFGEDAYEFKILFERKRGRTEAKMVFVRNELEVDPMTASGGGVIDVSAFALRVACLMLHSPRLSKVVVLDEPFRFVSAEYQDNVKSMLEELSKDLGIQLIQVTHNEALETGQVIQIG